MTNQKSERILLAATAAFLAALAVFAGLCFADNVSVIVRWWRCFLAGGDTAAVRGVLPALDWACVDHSAATTFIPLLGSASAALALWRASRGRSVNPGTFPFFAGSDRLFIALGLFGTLWGIIVIGYHDLESVTMADLMHCLHTALLSTLMAVVWVYIVDRAVLRPWLTAVAIRCGVPIAGGDGLAAAVDRFIARLDDAAQTFVRRQREFEESALRRQREFEAAMEDRRRRVDAAIERRIARGEKFFADRAAAELAAWERRHAEYEREFAVREREYSEFFVRRLAEAEKRAAESDAAALAAKRKLVEVSRALSGMEKLP